VEETSIVVVVVVVVIIRAPKSKRNEDAERQKNSTTYVVKTVKKIMGERERSSSVEMIRILPRKGEDDDEELFDVEKELGRDVNAVFGKKVGGVSIGGTESKFVTAEELERLRKERGGGEDAEVRNAEPVKPLWQILQEQRDLKEEKFQEGWRTMKEGKNRPLEEDEIEFLDEVEEQKRENEKRKREEEKELSKQFKLARAKNNSKNLAAGMDKNEEKKKRDSNGGDGRDDGVGVDGDKDDGDFAAKKASANAKKKLLKVAKKKTTLAPPTDALAEKDEEKVVENNASSLGLLGGYSSSSE